MGQASGMARFFLLETVGGAHFLWFTCFLYLDVSENNGTPKSSHFNRVFHYKPSIWGTPIFVNTHLDLYQRSWTAVFKHCLRIFWAWQRWNPHSGTAGVGTSSVWDLAPFLFLTVFANQSTPSPFARQDILNAMGVFHAGSSFPRFFTRRVLGRFCCLHWAWCKIWGFMKMQQ